MRKGLEVAQQRRILMCWNEMQQHEQGCIAATLQRSVVPIELRTDNGANRVCLKKWRRRRRIEHPTPSRCTIKWYYHEPMVRWTTKPVITQSNERFSS